MKKTIVILAAFAMVFAFAATTMAADWNFYGSARMTTFWQMMDKDNPDNKMPAAYDDADTVWALQGNSRVGATVKAGDVGGGFEYGTGVNVRKLYGTWNFGSGTLLVGQTYTPITHLLSNQTGNGDNGLLNVGEMYAGRQPMIQFQFGSFKIALISPSVGTPDTAANVFNSTTGGFLGNTAQGLYGNAGVVNTDVTLPKIELNYNFKSDMFFVDVYGGYQTYDAVNATDSSKSIDAYVAGIDGGVTFGPATIKANLYTAQNSQAYGCTAATAGAPAAAVIDGNPNWDGTDYRNYTEMGGMLLAMGKFNDMVGWEAGIAYKSGEQEQGTGVSKVENTTMGYYLQIPLTLADGVFIVPELGSYNYGDADNKTTGVKTKRGNMTYFGAKWQINF
jgi:hypothetical protein